MFERQYQQKVVQYAPNPVPPEARLIVTCWAAPMFAIAFFWFGWTTYPSVSYWAPLLAGIPIGCSTGWIFLSLINYTIDTYLFAAASALAAQTACRSVFGAGFPLFATQMFDAMNPRWASTLLGCVAVVMTPMPFVLIKVGPALRRRSRFTPTFIPPQPKETQLHGSEAA